MCIERIEYDGKIFAIIVRASYEKEGINFISEKEYPLQLGLFKHKKGHIIKAHGHVNTKRTISSTQEILFFIKGKVKVYFYHDSKIVCENILNGGDILFIIDGEHGFEVLEDSKIIEVKQGPYLSLEEDKYYIEVKDDKSF